MAMVKHAMPSTVPNKRKHQAAVTRALLGGTGGTFSSSLFLEPKSRRKNQAGIRNIIRLPLTDLLYHMDMGSNNRGGKGYGSIIWHAERRTAPVKIAILGWQHGFFFRKFILNMIFF
jgi:hypothetical protein